jgi:hypothetical protein
MPRATKRRAELVGLFASVYAEILRLFDRGLWDSTALEGLKEMGRELAVMLLMRNELV